LTIVQPSYKKSDFDLIPASLRSSPVLSKGVGWRGWAGGAGVLSAILELMEYQWLMGDGPGRFEARRGT
jgi:hypothetical protein